MPLDAKFFFLQSPTTKNRLVIVTFEFFFLRSQDLKAALFATRQWTNGMNAIEIKLCLCVRIYMFIQSRTTSRDYVAKILTSSIDFTLLCCAKQSLLLINFPLCGDYQSIQEHLIGLLNGSGWVKHQNNRKQRRQRNLNEKYFSDWFFSLYKIAREKSFIDNLVICTIFIFLGVLCNQKK